MEITFHLGVHATDDGALQSVLRQNAPLLARQGIAVPGSDSYHGLLRLSARGFAGQAPPDRAERSALLAALALRAPGQPVAEKLVLSFESYLGFAQDAVAPPDFYPAARTRARVLGQIFAGQKLHLAMALRNPATLLPVLSQRRVARELAPLDLAPEAVPLWSGLVQALQGALPQARLTLWCDEDAPVIWHRILREIAGCDEATDLEGALAWPARWLTATPDGAQRLQAWFETHRPARDESRAQALRDWLAREAGLHSVEAGLPGWSAADIDAVSATYDEDCAKIAQMPGVNFLLPPGA